MVQLAAPRPQAARSCLSRGQLAAAALATGAGVAYLAAVDPSSGGWFPSCPTRAVTGIWCPACGLTRATHHLLNGEVVAAIKFNLFVVPVLVVLGLVAVRETRRSLRQSGRTWVPPGWAVLAAIAVLVVYAAVRNVPSLGVLRGA